MDFGKGGTAGAGMGDSSATVAGGVGTGVAERLSGGVAVRFLDTCSTRAAALAGSFLLRSMMRESQIRVRRSINHRFIRQVVASRYLAVSVASRLSKQSLSNKIQFRLYR